MQAQCRSSTPTRPPVCRFLGGSISMGRMMGPSRCRSLMRWPEGILVQVLDMWKCTSNLARLLLRQHAWFPGSSCAPSLSNSQFVCSDSVYQQPTTSGSPLRQSHPFCRHWPLQQYSTHVHDAGDPHGPPAFVFDIDGVLIRGKHVLPAAKAAMKKLCPQGQWAFPVVFLTNGGGVTEAKKAEQLSQWLHVPVTEKQVVLSHSPMRDLVPRLHNSPVLVAGGGEVVKVARGYGFNRVVHTDQLSRAWTPTHEVPGMPSPQVQHTHHAQAHTQHPAHPNIDPDAWQLGSEQHPIQAVMVMTDPSDWLLDLQLIIDVLTARGVPTRKEAQPGAPPVELYFSNGDLLWANEHPRNRFGQGAFAHILLALYKEITGLAQCDFPVKFFGKPNPEPYRLAERLLLDQAIALGLVSTPSAAGTPSASHTAPTPASQGSLASAAHSAAHTAGEHSAAALQAPGQVRLPFSGIYAVGDNPAADVRGANAAGAPWVSVLVRTGVFQGPGVNCSRDVAEISVQDVLAAVDAGLHRSRSVRFHSMR